MFARLSAFVIWSLVAATGVFWVLRLIASPPPVPPYAVAVGNAVAVRGDLSRLFGAPPRSPSLAQATPEAPSRFKLVGVMAPPSGPAQSEAGHGVALIAVDGKPAKPYAVGARLDSDLVLQSVGLRTASLGPAQGARSVLLELPALAPPNTGTLSPGVAAPPAGVATPVPPVATTRMQSAIQAAQAAQAGQAAPGGPGGVQGTQASAPGVPQGIAQPAPLPGVQGIVPFPTPPGPQPIEQPAGGAIVTSPSGRPTVHLPTPGGLPSQ